MGPQSRSPLRSLLAVAIFSLVTWAYVNGGSLSAEEWGNEEEDSPPLLRSQSSAFAFGGNGSENSKLNNRGLINLAMPSYIKKLVQLYQDEPDTTYLDKLLDGVLGDDCNAHLREWFYRVTAETNWLEKKNAWALHLVDSWGKIPEGILRGHVTNFGDFDECVNIEVTNLELHHDLFPDAKTNFGGRYCMTYLADFNSTWAAAGREPPPRETPPEEEGTTETSVGEVEEEFVGGERNMEGRKAVTFAEFQKFLTGTIGILAPKPASGTCMPSSCSQRDIQRVFVNGLTMIYNMTKNQTDETDLVDYLRARPWPLPMFCRDKNTRKLDAAAISVIVLISVMGGLALCSGTYDYWLSHYAKDKKRPTSLAFKYFMAFSLYTNTRKWLSTRKSPEDFGCLHGIRSLTTAWVVLAHTYAVNMFVPAWNHYDLIHMTDSSPTVLAVINGFFCVDTFFLMSGLLACYNVLKLLDKSKGKLNIPMFYLHRYLRLTPTYAILVGIGSTLFTYMGNGPYWYIMEVQEQYCKDNWWTNLLYINNVFKTGEMCNGESWYLANDMQFYILSPFIIYPIWKWEKIGLLLSLVYFLASCAAFPILINYHDTPYSTVVVRRMLNWQTMIYIRPYSRIGVFLVGIWLGWLLYKTKGKKVKIPLVGVLVGWILSAAAALYAIYCILPWYDPSYEIPKGYGYFYAAISRPLWGFSISWVIFACVKGYGGLINEFLSWSVFMPLGRLTFCVYLTSYHFQQMYLLKSVQPPQYDTYYLINLFFAHFFLSCMVGYVCTLVFESPFMILQKLIFEGGGGKPAPKSKEAPGQLEANAQSGVKVATD